MGALVVVGVVLLVLYVMLAVRMLQAAKERRQGIRPDSAPQGFPNHQAMARWIERQIQDDMVRPLLSRDDQAEAVRLLRRFYGEENAQSLPEPPKELP